MRELIKFGVAAILVITATATASAQPPSMPPSAIRSDEASQVATGWVLVTEGKPAEAAQLATQVLARNPRSVPALTLLIEADIARGGSTTALASYESWLGTRTLEEPSILRRIARALLYEYARQERDIAARAESLKALVAEGDADALSVMRESARGSGENDVRTLAALGDAEAIDRVVEQLKTIQGLKLREIRVLGESRSPRAAAPLVAVLSDPRPENRAQAADALGRIDRPDVIPHLKALLSDPHGQVRLSAAGALFRLGDVSGEAMIRELAVSQNVADRRTAALLLASRPDETWKALVRELTTVSDSVVRLDAARLLADHDPELARSVFETLRNDENLAIREETELTLAQGPLMGFSSLRQFIRTGSGLVKVRAAARLLVMTR
jgi:HEAT repeat protein